MKPTKFLTYLMIAAVTTMIAGNATAYPLILKSLSGTIASTANAGSSTTASKYSVVLKKLLLVVNNQVVLNGGPTPPASAMIAVDPYQYDSVNGFQVYLTNSTGYYYNLSSNNIAYFNIYDIATTVKGKSTSASETDTLLVELDLFGIGPDGAYYEFDVKGTGKLTAVTNAKTGIVKMTILGKNDSGYGANQDSDDGVSNGGFNLQGSGIPDVSEPYSTFWYFNIGGFGT